ncbi:signal peptidase II [Myxococcota bacterium]|nr:signal peptidase II [Myxococcota bacterium]
MTGRMTPKFKVLSCVFAVSVVLDQYTKHLIDQNLSFADRVPVIEGLLYLTHVRNTGAAFGLFADTHPTFRIVFFLVLSLVAMGIILSFYRRLEPGERLAALALGLILGGATGNLIDRVQLFEVIDFVHVRLWGGYSWPDFNVADSCIVVGVGILILEMLAAEGEQRAHSDSSPETSDS